MSVHAFLEYMIVYYERILLDRGFLKLICSDWRVDVEQVYWCPLSWRCRSSLEASTPVTEETSMAPWARYVITMSCNAHDQFPCNVTTTRAFITALVITVTVVYFILRTRIQQDEPETSTLGVQVGGTSRFARFTQNPQLKKVKKPLDSTCCCQVVTVALLPILPPDSSRSFRFSQ